MSLNQKIRAQIDVHLARAMHHRMIATNLINEKCTALLCYSNEGDTYEEDDLKEDNRCIADANQGAADQLDAADVLIEKMETEK